MFEGNLLIFMFEGCNERIEHLLLHITTQYILQKLDEG